MVTQESTSSSSGEEEEEPTAKHSSKSFLKSVNLSSANTSFHQKLNLNTTLPIVQQQNSSSNEDEKVKTKSKHKRKSKRDSFNNDSLKSNNSSKSLNIVKQEEKSDSEHSDPGIHNFIPKQLPQIKNENDDCNGYSSNEMSSQESNVMESTDIKKIEEKVQKIRILQDLQILPLPDPKVHFEELYPNVKEIIKRKGLKIGASDDVYLFQMPKNVDVQNLLNKDINIIEGGKLNIGEKFTIKVSPEVPPPALVVSNKCNILHFNGNIVMRKYAKPTKEVKLPVIEKSNVPLPEDLLNRHPLFGYDFVEKIQIEETVKNKLENAIDDMFKQEMKNKKKKVKKQTKVTDDEPVFDLFNTNNQDDTFSDLFGLNSTKSNNTKNKNCNTKSPKIQLTSNNKSKSKSFDEMELSSTKTKKYKKSFENVSELISFQNTDSPKPLKKVKRSRSVLIETPPLTKEETNSNVDDEDIVASINFFNRESTENKKSSKKKEYLEAKSFDTIEENLSNVFSSQSTQNEDLESSCTKATKKKRKSKGDSTQESLGNLKNNSDEGTFENVLLKKSKSPRKSNKQAKTDSEHDKTFEETESKNYPKTKKQKLTKNDLIEDTLRIMKEKIELKAEETDTNRSKTNEFPKSPKKKRTSKSESMQDTINETMKSPKTPRKQKKTKRDLIEETLRMMKQEIHVDEEAKETVSTVHKKSISPNVLIKQEYSENYITPLRKEKNSTLVNSTLLASATKLPAFNPDLSDISISNKSMKTPKGLETNTDVSSSKRKRFMTSLDSQSEELENDAEIRSIKRSKSISSEDKSFSRKKKRKKEVD